MQTEIPVLQKN